jgi:hypothetical protein
MNYKQLGDKLLAVTLLLAGLSIFNAVIPAIAPAIHLGDWIIPFMRNSYLIGDIIFGLIIYRLTNQNRKVSPSIGLLSTTLPVFVPGLNHRTLKI